MTIVFLTIIINESPAQQRSFGLGVIIGEPTGLSAKLWTSQTTAFYFGIGLSLCGDRISCYDGYNDGSIRVHLHFDYLLHQYNAIGSTEEFPICYEVGG